MSKELLKIFNHQNEEVVYPLHNFHVYPCKFPAFIPREIIKKYARKGDIICDPFVGSGTTLLEATLLGYSSIGNDINPLSCLLAKVKAKPINKKLLTEIDSFTEHLMDEYKKNKQIKAFYYDGIDHWFQNNVIKELSLIKENILRIRNDNLKDLLFIVLSSIIVKVSNQESDTRYAAIDKKIKDFETIKIFIDKAKDLKKIYLDFFKQYIKPSIDVSVFQLDCRNLYKIKDNTVDLIITSPPYANTYDYYLYHKHRKYWLDMDVKYAQQNEIGSRREFSSLKENPKKWEKDISQCLFEMKRITKKGKNIFFIIGDSVINNKLIHMNKKIKNISTMIGLNFVDSVSSPLSAHSRIFNKNFVSKKNKEEHLILLRK